MTIQEAAKKWEVTEKTALDYIGNGYIFDLTCKDNQIILPDINKPYVKKKPDNIKAIDNYILKSLNFDSYLSYTILGISKEKFEERLKELEHKNLIHKKNKNIDDYKTNLNFILASNTETSHIEISLIKVNSDIKVADQIGLINGKIG